MVCEVALIGFGEAGSTFAEAAEWRARARAWDVDLNRREAMIACEVIASDTAAAALSNIPVVLSLVSADQVIPVADSYAPLLATGTLWCDMNSVAPDTKKAAAQVIEANGAIFVDCAILAPVKPARLEVPILLSGHQAHRAESALRALGFANVSVAGNEVGQASTIKMVRSIMIKGIEALTDELMQAAKAAGVVDSVLNSLDAADTAQSWAKRAEYNLERMATHGARRAAEMEECAKTLTSLGVAPAMTLGTIIRQRAAARKD